MIEILDPRHDPEPGYWAQLRKRAGLRADWSWEVLTAQAQLARTPPLITVLHDGGDLVAIMCATWTGLPARPTVHSRLRLGGLHVHAPGTGSTQGWWSDSLPLRELIRRYTKAMRHELGAGLRGLLLRQLTKTDLTELTNRPTLIRPTEPLGRIHTAGWHSRADWIATLTRSRRKSLRRTFRDIEHDPTLHLTLGPSIADPTAITNLIRHNELKYRHRFGPRPVAAGYIAELLAQPDVLLLSYTNAENTLLAVDVILDQPEWPIVKYWSALPFDQGGRPNLYFHHYAAIIDWAIQTGKRGVIVGRGKPELKASMGAHLTNQYAAALPTW